MNFSWETRDRYTIALPCRRVFATILRMNFASAVAFCARSLVLAFVAAGVVSLSAAEPAMHPIDELFTAWTKKLPEPASPTEGNGLGPSTCPIHRMTTFSLFAAIAKKVPVNSDADLVHLVKWARHADPCLRYIAVEAIMPRVGLSHDDKGLYHIDDVEGYEHHQVMIALHRKLTESKTAFDAKLFEGMYLTLTPDQARSLINGKWEEPFKAGMGYHLALEIDEKTISQSMRVEPGIQEPSGIGSPFVIKRVTVDEQQQILIELAINEVPHSKADYKVWPISKDIIWFWQGGYSWKKLQRVKELR